VYNPATGAVSAQSCGWPTGPTWTPPSPPPAKPPTWGDISLAKRTAVLFKFRELVAAHVDDLAELITAEHGKVLSDAKGEIGRGLEVIEYACGIPTLLKGDYSDQVSTGIDVFSFREPLGVVAGITPFNFPVMVPLWMAPDGDRHRQRLHPQALRTRPVGLDAAGQALEGRRPARRRLPGPARRQGNRGRAPDPPGRGRHLLRRLHPDRPVRPRDRHQARQARPGPGRGEEPRHHPARRRPGQRRGPPRRRRLRLRRGTLHGHLRRRRRRRRRDLLVKKVEERALAVKVNNGTAPDAEMGPVITPASKERIVRIVTEAEAAGAAMVVDGRDLVVPGHEDGFWVGPTVIDHVKTEMTAYSEEIFGPVLVVVRVDTLEDGIKLINANPYGNGTAIFTSSGAAARKFQRSVTVGMIGINVPLPVPVAYHSFGGWKASLFGDKHIYGPEGVSFYTRGKVITSRWPEPTTPPAPPTTSPPTNQAPGFRRLNHRWLSLSKPRVWARLNHQRKTTQS
jgi:malonate-semialdehyde dehydrogenase (acetylating)/methylmalonate-semialdehyde dehydrogenase